MTAITLTIQDQYKRALIFWALVFAVLACGATYVFMINKTVLNIVASQNAQNETLALNNSISQLESQNIALTSQITPEYATTIGFSEAANPQYISADASVGGQGAGFSIK